jgi:hypothetical protein
MILTDIVQALTKELKYLFFDKEGTVLLDTEIQGEVSANFPLCILEIEDAPESARLPGNGVTRFDLNFSLRIHNFEPNAFIDDDNGYAPSLLLFVDTIRQHFENEVWKVQEMVDLTTNYAFRITFAGGPNKAEPIDTEGGIAMGYRIMFNTIAVDQITNSTTNLVPSTAGSFTGTIVFKT